MNEFGDVMTSRMREFDKFLGTNNYVSHLDVDSTLKKLLKVIEQVVYGIENDRRVLAKTSVVDVANIGMVCFVEASVGHMAFEVIMKRLWRRILCLLGAHDWTTDEEQGKPLNIEEILLGKYGFGIYSKRYCKHCGHVARPL